jgi:chromosome segregation ATPase
MKSLSEVMEAMSWLLDVYHVTCTLPKGECYPTEPYGEVGASRFADFTIADLRQVPARVNAMQAENARLIADLAAARRWAAAWKRTTKGLKLELESTYEGDQELIAQLGRLTTERDDLRTEHARAVSDLEAATREVARLRDLLNRCYAERDAARSTQRAAQVNAEFGQEEY